MSSAEEGQGKLADQRTDAHMNRRGNLGELAASPAHELIQSLTAILHNAEAAQLSIPAHRTSAAAEDPLGHEEQ